MLYWENKYELILYKAKMRAIKIFLILTLFITFSTIGFSQTPKTKYHKVKVFEVLQVNSYTYLLVEEDTNNKWLAVPSFDPKIGETYFYKGGMEMQNFTSKELNRTFESVIFLSSVSKYPEEKKSSFQHSANIESKKVKNMATEKLTLTIEAVDGVISIADLLKNKESFDGKIAIIKGKVTKFNAQVMSKNWIHLQDGTEYEGKFDLTVTTNAEVAVGDIITIEGKLFLDRDFGYGYFYDVIIENAVLIK